MAVLKRVMQVYTAIEEIRSADLMRAWADVREVQREMVGQQEAGDRARREGLSALGSGDRTGQSASEALQDAAGVMHARLEPVYRQRQDQRASAQERYQISRMKREQMERLVKRAMGKAKVEEERKLQAASDDRFLARRWMAESVQMKKP